MFAVPSISRERDLFKTLVQTNGFCISYLVTMKDQNPLIEKSTFSGAARFMELVRAEELSNFLNRADNTSISREELSKLQGSKVGVQNDDFIIFYPCLENIWVILEYMSVLSLFLLLFCFINYILFLATDAFISLEFFSG